MANDGMVTTMLEGGAETAPSGTATDLAFFSDDNP
jgi:hypothetical protein